jgi:hypothetical protein
MRDSGLRHVKAMLIPGNMRWVGNVSRIGMRNDSFVRQSRVALSSTAIELSPESQAGSGHPSGGPLPLENAGYRGATGGGLPLSERGGPPQKSQTAEAFFNEMAAGAELAGCVYTIRSSSVI